MTTADTQDAVTPADSRNGEAGRLCVQRLVSKYPLQIVVRLLLVPGCMGRDKDGNAIMIWLAKGLDRDEATVTLWHEILHVLHSAGGTEHDENAIEAMAQKLAAACPEVLKICGVESHFANADLRQDAVNGRGA